MKIIIKMPCGICGKEAEHEIQIAEPKFHWDCVMKVVKEKKEEKVFE